MKLDHFLAEWKRLYARPLSVSVEVFTNMVKYGEGWELVDVGSDEVQFALKGGRFITAVDVRGGYKEVK